MTHKPLTANNKPLKTPRATLGGGIPNREDQLSRINQLLLIV